MSASFETPRLLGEPMVGTNTSERDALPDFTMPTSASGGAKSMHAVWIVRMKDGGGVIGRLGLRPVFINGREEIEVFYTLESQFWNQGFATESVRAVMELAAREEGLENIVAVTRENNQASIRVLEKSGFQFERDVVHDNVPQVLFRRTAGPN